MLFMVKLPSAMSGKQSNSRLIDQSIMVEDVGLSRWFHLRIPPEFARMLNPL